jgi:hypothetical protein
VTADRYLKIILTIIAVELLWIGLKSTAVPVAAQADATPVVIRGIEIDGAGGAFLPVAVVGSYRDAPRGVRTIEKLTTRVEGITMGAGDRALKIETDRPLKIESDRPLKVENVNYTPSQRPGE